MNPKLRNLRDDLLNKVKKNEEKWKESAGRRSDFSRFWKQLRVDIQELPPEKMDEYLSNKVDNYIGLTEADAPSKIFKSCLPDDCDRLNQECKRELFLLFQQAITLVCLEMDAAEKAKSLSNDVRTALRIGR